MENLLILCVASECQRLGRHSTTKRPDCSRPAAWISRPAVRAISRNSVRLRLLPPTSTIMSSSGDGPDALVRRHTAEDDDAAAGLCRLGAPAQENESLRDRASRPERS